LLNYAKHYGKLQKASHKITKVKSSNTPVMPLRMVLGPSVVLGRVSTSHYSIIFTMLLQNRKPTLLRFKVDLLHDFLLFANETNSAKQLQSSVVVSQRNRIDCSDNIVIKSTFFSK